MYNATEHGFQPATLKKSHFQYSATVLMNYLSLQMCISYMRLHELLTDTQITCTNIDNTDTFVLDIHKRMADI